MGFIRFFNNYLKLINLGNSLTSSFIIYLYEFRTLMARGIFSRLSIIKNKKDTIFKALIN